MGLLSNSIIIRFMLGMVCFAWFSLVYADVNLDKLTACDDIAQLYDSMKAASARTVSCRAPRNSLERLLVKGSGFASSQWCFDQATPAPFLNGFSCAWPSWPKVYRGSTLVCFRSTSDSDVGLYKEQYGQRFKIPVSKYLSNAALCRASNGDTATAQPTLFPDLLKPISHFEFGFISPLGETTPSDSSILHGYATTDPTISGNKYIEFIYMFVNAPKYVPSTYKRKTAGDWMIDIDDSDEFDDQINQVFRNEQKPVWADGTTYQISYHGNIRTSQEEKLTRLENIQLAIASVLKIEGFRDFSDAELKKLDVSRDDLLKSMRNNAMFGAKNSFATKLNSGVMLLNEQRPSCTMNGAGRIEALVFSTKPTPDVQSDFGSITLLVLGVKECARTTTLSTRRFVSGLIEEASARLIATLQQKQLH